LSTDLLVSSDPWENRVAILEDGKLSEYYIERDERVIGSIYKGKVQNVLPGMGASFVDIGLGRNAFLYVDDINKTPLNIGDVEIAEGRSGWTINEKVSKGDDVLVQIVKEPRGLKGARVSTNISLPGRYLILMPTGKYSGVSRKIESADERNRLKGVMKAIRPEGMATVVRTAAGGVSNAELIADLGVLIRMWHGILENYKSAPTPSLLHKDMNLVYKAARDFITPDVANVWIDDADEAERVRDFMRLLGPQYVERIKPYPAGAKLFADFKIDEEVAKLMKPTAKLPSGGSIVIETTEALTVIDVNSGKFTGGKNLDDTIVKTNIEAAAEIARQVRLRDIGGIIVCDFIDMQSENDRNKVIKTLEDGLKKDRTRSTIQSFSPLGLLEFTRKRVGKDLAGQLRSTCPMCTGLGSVMSPETVTISTFREIANHKNGHAEHVHVSASPQVAAQIEFWYEDELTKLKDRVALPIDVRVDATVHPETPLVTWGNGLPELPAVRVGDEFDVELINMRLPTATSAAAVVNGRLIEVENAANGAGTAIKIRIIDVDGNDILAEPRFPIGSGQGERGERGAGAAATGDGKKRRRRGGRGRKPLTAAEQQEELRELAEEAAKGLGSRPAPVIGISTTEEAVAEDTVARNEGAPKRSTPASMHPAPDAESASVHPPRGRGDRGRRSEAPAPQQPRNDRPAAAPSRPAPSGGLAPLPGETLSGALVGKMPGETLSGDRVNEFVAPAPQRSYAPVAPEIPPEYASALEDAADMPDGDAGDQAGPKRRRRRRRGRGGAGADGVVVVGTESPALDGDDEDDEAPAVAAAAASPSRPPAETVDVDGRKKRRRRRRRRGGSGVDTGMLGADGQTTSAPLPDRHIIRVDGEGGAEPTGQNARPEPNRALARVDRPRKGEIAIEPPPRSLTAPVEKPPRLAAPSRRTGGARPASAKPKSIAAPVAVKALPAPARKKTAAPAAAAKKSPAVKAPAVKAPAAKKTAAKKTAGAKKATTVKKATAKKATAKKATSVKAAPVKKATAAKKTTAKKTAAKK
jgi:ribonuclease G